MHTINNQPSLFKWAPSELSQDAFICWLLEWINYPNNSALHETAKQLINQLTDNKTPNINAIEIKQQIQNIDILCILNNGEFIILIEDKTNTKQHSGQLKKYLTSLKEAHANAVIFPVYFKTGDQSSFKEVEKAGYKKFLRSSFLEVLKFGKDKGITNSIFCDFHDYLIKIENSVQSYKALLVPVKDGYPNPNDWNTNRDCWKGFYSELQKQLQTGKWDYVPQKNGGFFGFWWHGKSSEFQDTKFNYYLQLEHEKLCFKLRVFNRDNAKKIRDYYSALLFSTAEEHSIPIEKKRARIGTTMTIATLKDPYIAIDPNKNGLLDFKGTLESIKKIQNIIDTISLKINN